MPSPLGSSTMKSHVPSACLRTTSTLCNGVVTGSPSGPGLVLLPFTRVTATVPSVLGHRRDRLDVKRGLGVNKALHDLTDGRRGR